MTQLRYLIFVAQLEQLQCVLGEVCVRHSACVKVCEKRLENVDGCAWDLDLLCLAVFEALVEQSLGVAILTINSCALTRCLFGPTINVTSPSLGARSRSLYMDVRSESSACVAAGRFGGLGVWIFLGFKKRYSHGFLVISLLRLLHSSADGNRMVSFPLRK